MIVKWRGMITRRCHEAVIGALLLASGCGTTVVRVMNRDLTVPGARIYANGAFIGTTDPSGRAAVSQLAAGEHLVASKLIQEVPGYRANHGPENGGLGWTERVYITSVDVNDDATLSTFTVTDPNAEQLLTVKEDNVLIGLHFTISVEWDASRAELADLQSKVQSAANYMYNASDGQIVFEQVEITDDGLFLGDAEYGWYANNTVWPNTNDTGGFFGRTWYGRQTSVAMSRRTDQGLNTFQVIDHELGHLAFGLHDEYHGFNVGAGNYCATKILDADPVYGAGGPKASCVMSDPGNGTKFCAALTADPHRSLLLQGGPCWDNIVITFQDSQPRPRWSMKTPEIRPGRAIVGRLPDVPVQWQPRITVTNGGAPSLCREFRVALAYAGGAPWASGTVLLRLAGSGAVINEGNTGDDGSITIVGAHLGDQLLAGGTTIAVDTSRCEVVE